uniref:SVSP2 n=2 Tax=Theileria parva TaxID=5875 RepID=Q4N6E5_THEPA|eukprot:XP_766746.1 hypothetical protein [Theileria parva strain Muguga]
MNKYVIYTYFLVLSIIGFVRSSDKQGASGAGDDDSDDENYDLIVRELETLIEDDSQTVDTSGDTSSSVPIQPGTYSPHPCYQPPPQTTIPPAQTTIPPAQDPNPKPPVTEEAPKYYLISPEKGKDGKYKLIPITHLEYTPPKPKQKPISPTRLSSDTTQISQKKDEVKSTPGKELDQTKPGSSASSEGDSDSEENFDVIVSGIEKLLEDEDAQPITQPENVVSPGAETPAAGTDKLPSIVFLTDDPTGKLVPMNDSKYKILISDRFSIKFKFGARLIKILCDGITVWTYTPGLSYPRTVIFRKVQNIFEVNFNNRVSSCILQNGIWVERVVFAPQELKLYRKSSSGNYYRMTHNKYNIQLTPSQSFQYVFNTPVLCEMIQIEHKIVWIRKPNDPPLLKLTYFSKSYVRLYFRYYSIEIYNSNDSVVTKTFPRNW